MKKFSQTLLLLIILTISIVFASCNDTPEHVHIEVTVAAVEATCYSTGLTEGKRCSECKEIIVAQQVVPMLNHIYDSEYDAKCNVCEYERTIVCKHDDPTRIVVVEAVAPTCQETGLTEGIKCTICDTLVVPQLIVQTIDCIAGDWIVDLKPTHTENGKCHTECTMCGALLQKETISSVGGRCNFISGVCTICGQERVSGLYNTNNEIIVSWKELTETYKLDVTIDYNGSDDAPNSYKTTESSGYYVLTHYDVLSSGTMLIIDDSIECLGVGALGYCESIEYVSIPTSVSNIALAAFHSCINLKTIIFEGTVQEWNAIIKSPYGWSQNVPATYVQCSDGTVSLN